MRSNMRRFTPLNLALLYIQCLPQHSPLYSHCHASSKCFVATQRLFSQAISSDAENKHFNGSSIRAMRADYATLSRPRECAVYEVCVAGINRVFLALLASEGLSSMRAALLARVSAVGQSLGEFYRNALIACDVDATDLHLSSVAGETTIVLAFRCKCYSKRSARDFSDMLLLHYEKHHFAGLPAAQYWRTADITIAASSVRVPLFCPPQAARSPTPAQRLYHSAHALLEPLANARLARPVCCLSPVEFVTAGHVRAVRPPLATHRRRKRCCRVTQEVTAGGSLADLWLACCSQCQPAAYWLLYSCCRACHSLASPIRSSCGPIPRAALTAKRAACHSRSRCALTCCSSYTCCRAAAASRTRTSARISSPSDSSFATERAAAPIPPACKAASSTPAPGPAIHPIALSRAEYHARYAATHPPRNRKCEKGPTPATFQAQQPESAGAASKQPKCCEAGMHKRRSCAVFGYSHSHDDDYGNLFHYLCAEH